MKKVALTMVVAMVCFVALQAKTTAPPDTAKARTEIISSLETLHKTMSQMDAQKIQASTTADFILLGTDPGEFMTKEEVIEMVSNPQMQAANQEQMQDYTIDKRKILLSEDGMSAITIEQFMMPAFSKYMPVRLITHMIRDGDEWKYDFISWNFIPANEDLGPINAALGSKKSSME